MRVDQEICVGCGFCMRDCPVAAVRIIKKKAVIDTEKCTNCKVCSRVCPEGAMIVEEIRPLSALE